MNADDLMAKALQAVESARILITSGDTDGACSRAYYAMFDAARAALRFAGHDVGKTHSGVLHAFSDLFVKTGAISKETGKLLKTAETIWYLADYSDTVVSFEDAADIVEKADTFVMNVRFVLAPPTHNQIPDRNPR